jgi:hypothetical protein
MAHWVGGIKLDSDNWFTVPSCWTSFTELFYDAMTISKCQPARWQLAKNKGLYC